MSFHNERKITKNIIKYYYNAYNNSSYIIKLSRSSTKCNIIIVIIPEFIHTYIHLFPTIIVKRCDGIFKTVSSFVSTASFNQINFSREERTFRDMLATHVNSITNRRTGEICTQRLGYFNFQSRIRRDEIIGQNISRGSMKKDQHCRSVFSLFAIGIKEYIIIERFPLVSRARVSRFFTFFANN